MDVLPNFFIVGAAKAGTTSLVAYMQQHPEIYFSPVKEPKYFSLDDNRFPHRGPGADLADARVIRDSKAYLGLFAGADTYRARGEASVDYLYFPGVPEKIFRAVPEARIIIVLRDPVERAYSAYMHYVRDGWETLSFEDALVQEEVRRRDNWEFFWHYRAVGLYADQVERYLRVFPRDQVHVVLFEDLVGDTPGAVKGLFSFLGVDDSVVPDVTEQLNRSGQPKSRLLHNLVYARNPVRSLVGRVVPASVKRSIGRMVSNINLKKRPLSETTRRVLRDQYRSDIIRLEAVIQRDLSRWYTESAQ